VFAEALRRQLLLLQIELSAPQLLQLEQHFNLLSRWNKVTNLTSLTNVDEIVQRHYSESLFLGMHLPNNFLKIIDIGSGGGFPGVPLAILRPDCEVQLVESNQRKAVFLCESTRELGNVQVHAKRAEDLSGKFDWAVSRAVSFKQIGSLLRTIAPNVALLGGADSPEEHFTWNRIKLPWGDHRFLWLGRST